MTPKRARPLFLGCLLGAILWCGGANADVAADRTYLAGVRAYEQGFYDVAALQFQEFLDANPASERTPEVLYLLAMAHVQQKHWKEADPFLQRLVAGHPESARREHAMLVLGEARYRAENFGAAALSLDELLKAFPKGEHACAARYLRGLCRRELKQTGGELDDMRAAAGCLPKRDERRSAALLALVRGATGREDWPEAAKLLDELDGIPGLNAGVKQETALQRFALALRGNDDDWLTREGVGRFNLLPDDKKGGVAFAIGQSFWKKERFADALQWFDQSDDPEARLFAGLSAKRAGQDAAARERLERFLESHAAGDSAGRAQVAMLELTAKSGDLGAVRKRLDALMANEGALPIDQCDGLLQTAEMALALSDINAAFAVLRVGNDPCVDPVTHSRRLVAFAYAAAAGGHHEEVIGTLAPLDLKTMRQGEDLAALLAASYLALGRCEEMDRLVREGLGHPLSGDWRYRSLECLEKTADTNTLLIRFREEWDLHPTAPWDRWIASRGYTLTRERDPGARLFWTRAVLGTLGPSEDRRPWLEALLSLTPQEDATGRLSIIGELEPLFPGEERGTLESMKLAALLRLDRRDEAAALYEALLARPGGTIAPGTILAGLLLRYERHEDAEALADANRVLVALRGAPQERDGLRTLGAMALRTKDWVAASSLYARLSQELSTSGERREAAFTLGGVELNRGRPLEAARAYLRVDGGEHHAEALFRAAGALHFLERPREALAALDCLTRLYPDGTPWSMRGWLLAGRCQAEIDQRELAEASYRSALNCAETLVEAETILTLLGQPSPRAGNAKPPEEVKDRK